MEGEPSSHIRPSQPKRQKSIKSGTWLPDEDERLMEAVARQGTRGVFVATDVGTRNGDQCAKRWNENLNPKLDHSAWSAEEEQNLVSCVSLYGHNWKFIAENFFETRAPLALKNRYSLLKRRSKRKGSRPRSPQRSASGSSGFPQFDQYWHPSSGSVTPSPGSTIDLTALPTDDQTSPMHMQAYRSMSFVPSRTPGTTTSVGTSFNTSTALPINDDQNLVWPQSPFQTSNNSFTRSFRNSETMGSEMQMSSISMLPESYAGVSCPNNSKQHADVPMSTSSGKLDGEAGSVGIEYSVTCQRGKLRTVVDHLVDAAISESAEGSEKDDPVTLKLHLKV